VAHVTAGGGLNGAAVLNGSTVFNDGAPDLLDGGAGQDAYFASLGDVLGSSKKDDVFSI
jgi:hypothetical protein